MEGVLDVDGEDEAREMLQRENLIPYKLVLVAQRRSLVQLLPALFPPSPKELIEYTRGDGVVTPVRHPHQGLAEHSSGPKLFFGT